MMFEREYNKPIKRKASEVKIDYEASDSQDLEQWSWEGNSGYVEVAGDVYYVKDKKIYYVKNIRADYSFGTGEYNIYDRKAGPQIPDDIKKKLKKSKLKRNGKDMVFYHGTDSDFKKFVNNFEGQNFSMGNYWKGMYFTETPEYAETFGNTMKVVAINATKPIWMKSNKMDLEEEKWHETDINSFEEYLQKQGYDAIINHNKKTSQMSEVIVFDAKKVFIVSQDYTS